MQLSTQKTVSVRAYMLKTQIDLECANTKLNANTSLNSRCKTVTPRSTIIICG